MDTTSSGRGLEKRRSSSGETVSLKSADVLETSLDRILLSINMAPQNMGAVVLAVRSIKLFCHAFIFADGLPKQYLNLDTLDRTEPSGEVFTPKDSDYHSIPITGMEKLVTYRQETYGKMAGILTDTVHST